MHTTRKILVAGSILIFLLTGLVFFCLDYYMSVQTETDIRRVASVHLEGMMNEELNRFEVVKDIFFRRNHGLIDIFNHLDVYDRAEIQRKVAEYSFSQSLPSCSIISSSGHIEHLFGTNVKKLNDPEFVIDRLQNLQRGVTAGKDEFGSIVVLCLPYFMPMENGEHSIGILCYGPLEVFSRTLNLTGEKTLVYYHIIRRDSSYVVENKDTYGENYFKKFLSFSTPVDKTPEAAMEELRLALKEGKPFQCHTIYTYPNTHLTQRRTVHAVPMPESNWYLLCVIPYGELDAMIEYMGSSRAIGTLISVGVIALGILVFLFVHLRASNRDGQWGEQVLKLPDRRPPNRPCKLSVRKRRLKKPNI